MAIALIYLTIVAIGAGSVALRHGPILLKGWRLFWLTVVAFAAQIAIRPAPVALWLAIFAIAAGGSWFARKTWFVFKVEPAAIRSAIESRLQRVLVAFMPDHDSYRLRMAGGPVRIRIRTPPGFTVLTFEGNWQQNKARVAQAFLSKYFEPMFPRLRIRV